MNNKNLTESDFQRQQELPRKAVFQQIFSGNLLKDQFYPQKQKTRSNYQFIIILNLIAFVLAVFGGFWVYHIFKIQEIQLLEGEGAVKTLELSILQQLDEKRQDEFLQKEQELKLLKQALDESQKKIEESKNNIKVEAEKEFDKKRETLQQQITIELQGKSAQEQAVIRARYERQLQQLKEELDNVIQIKYKNLDETFQKEQGQTIQETSKIQNEIEKVQVQLQESQQRIQSIVYTNESTIASSIATKSRSEDIAKIFLNIQTALQKNEYRQAEDRIKSIKNIYKKKIIADDLSMQDKVDLFLVGILETYVTNMTQLSNLSTELLTLQSNHLLLSNNNQNFLSIAKKTKKEMNEIQMEIDRLKMSNDILLDFKMKILAKNDNNSNLYAGLIERIQILVRDLNKGKEDQFDEQIILIKEKEPAIIELLSSYSNYQILIDTKKSQKLFTQTEKLFNNKNYQKALEGYQSIVRLYPKSQKMDVVLNHMYLSMKNLLGNTNFVMMDSLVTTKLQREQRSIIEKDKQVLTYSQIVYLQNPEGYVFDIIDNEALVLLIPGSKLKNKEKIQFLRVINDEVMQLHYISDGIVIKLEGNIVYISKFKSSRIKIGDLIYLK
ncbi:MAG: hypothetical protein ACRCTJ_06590 [Brevinema sp.]